MASKIANIVRFLSEEFSIECKEYSENKFELETSLSDHDHRTFLDFEVSSDIIRVQLKHLFGNFNVEKEIGTQELLQMLVENSGTFQTTSAYLCVRIVDNTPYVALEAYHHFHMKWEDKDIADIIQLQFLDIKMGLIKWTFPDSIYLFHK